MTYPLVNTINMVNDWLSVRGWALLSVLDHETAEIIVDSLGDTVMECVEGHGRAIQALFYDQTRVDVLKISQGEHYTAQVSSAQSNGYFFVVGDDRADWFVRPK